MFPIVNAFLCYLQRDIFFFFLLQVAENLTQCGWNNEDIFVLLFSNCERFRGRNTATGEHSRCLALARWILFVLSFSTSRLSLVSCWEARRYRRYCTGRTMFPLLFYNLLSLILRPDSSHRHFSAHHVLSLNNCFNLEIICGLLCYIADTFYHRCMVYSD